MMKTTRLGTEQTVVERLCATLLWGCLRGHRTHTSVPGPLPAGSSETDEVGDVLRALVDAFAQTPSSGSIWTEKLRWRGDARSTCSTLRLQFSIYCCGCWRSSLVEKNTGKNSREMKREHWEQRKDGHGRDWYPSSIWSSVEYFDKEVHFTVTLTEQTYWSCYDSELASMNQTSSVG